MKIHLLTLLAAGAIALAGCSSPYTRMNKGPVNARTFSFVTVRASPPPAFADGREAIHRTIQDAITQNLAGKGVAKVAVGGDVTVAYLVIVGNNATTESIDTYFGYSGDASALHDKAHEAYTSSKNPNYFEAGTLLVDIVDAKTHALLKRNYVVRPLLRDATAEVRVARIQEAVNAVLGDLRIAH